MLITHMQDMQEVTQELHYENYRSEKLARGRQAAAAAAGGGGATPARSSQAAPSPGGASKDNLLMQKEEEIRRMREMMERLQAELEKEKHTPPDTPIMSQEAR